MSSSTTRKNEAYTLEVDNGRLVVKACGRWDLHSVKDIDRELTADLKTLGYGPGEADEDESYEQVVFDFQDLERIDTAGAYVLTRALGCHDGYCRMWSVINCDKGQKVLMSVAAEASQGMAPAPKKPWYAPIERLGHGTMRAWSEIFDTIVFFGQFTVVLIKMLLQPHRIRWKSVVALTEEVGLDAMPIVVILSFFIGAVIAFMGSDLLEVLGFQVFVVDLVGVSVLREFAVLITAILLAGRSNSAFTAQIGSMKMRQEIDAMTVIGLNTSETLVVPRALGCLISAPILTFAAMMAGILGGLLVCWTQGISPILFTTRLTEVVDVKHFWVGMVKAPVYGLVVAIIGCRQGLAVQGSVESLGSRTTTSVVQAIFTVIFLDALFAMMFLEMGV
jgi:phospholipid/cholesterol/gamma-HCH transport system permease protein